MSMGFNIFALLVRIHIHERKNKEQKYPEKKRTILNNRRNSNIRFEGPIIVLTELIDKTR